MLPARRRDGAAGIEVDPALQMADQCSTLPLIDAHTIVRPLARPDAWQRLLRAIARSWLLGARGFPRRHADAPSALRLGGSHVFAAYELCFDLDEHIDNSAIRQDGTPRTVVRATTYAWFTPGPGGLYRTLVISSGVHAAVVRRFLNGLREQPATRERSRWSQIEGHRRTIQLNALRTSGTAAVAATGLGGFQGQPQADRQKRLRQLLYLR